MENFHIRRLKADDADAITEIYAAITRRSVEPDFKRVVEGHAQNGEEACFVAEHEGKVVGFMISYILTAGFGETKSAWIATVGVDPEFMGQGIGAEMARKTFEIYRDTGIEKVYTTVRWDSTDLLSFFKTLGFDRSEFINL
ncbi:MAG: GNAT family N-acetyltransferase, partial [Deltaproteobacteria bacterium]|nr:GNAT family N-acetyltransferase [Deltaproteobacteria bacterium]MBW2487779.1 GNAT family N-acetyltransferase [Deltaproteobacteria bacterium]